MHGARGSKRYGVPPDATLRYRIKLVSINLQVRDLSRPPRPSTAFHALPWPSMRPSHAVSGVSCFCRTYRTSIASLKCQCAMSVRDAQTDPRARRDEIDDEQRYSEEGGVVINAAGL